jgi:hypothetical protein
VAGALADRAAKAHPERVEPEELLEQRPRHVLLRTRGRRWTAGVLAALAVGALLVVRLGHDDAPTRPDAAVVSDGAVVSMPPVPTIEHSRAAQFTYDPTVCSNAPLCNVSSGLPDALLTAIRQYVPGVRSVRSHTVGTFLQVPARNGLWYRQLDLAAGAVRIQIIVQRSAPRPESAPTDTEVRGTDRSIGFTRILTGMFAISVEFIGPAGYAPPMPAIRALAADPRLLVTS